MTAFTSHTSTRQGPLWDLAAIWVTLSVTLAYLDVPIVNAPRFATALVLQAALGTWFVTKLLRGVQPSLLMLMGPGLILGGALSFAIFQMVGRGVVGVVISAATGVVAIVSLAREGIVSAAPPFRLERFLHLLGLAALGMASEFEWLLIPALGCFFAGLLWIPKIGSTRIMRTAAVAIAISSFALAPVFRGAWWWIITDDYNFFEVLSRHITDSGPFAKWGMLDASRYHWLSYGWTGLLDYSAGSPNALVTLTRVMPLVYSLGLAASLLMIAGQLSAVNRTTMYSAVPVWALLANFKLDWAATSTAGTYGVLAAVIALFANLGERPVAIPRRMLLYSTLFTVLCFTKLPSALVLIPLIFGHEALWHYRGVERKSVRLTGAVIGVVLGSVLGLATLPLLSSILGDFSVEAKRLPGLLWFYGPLAALATVVVRNLWLVMWMAVGWIALLRLAGSPIRSSSQLSLLMLSPLLATAVAMESLVAGPFNVHEYFSGPNYFMAGLVILVVATVLAQNSDSPQKKTFETIRLWTPGLAGILVWTSLVNELSLPSFMNRASFLNAVTDWRSLAGALLIASVGIKRNLTMQYLRTSLLIVLGVFLVTGVSGQVRQLVNEGVQPVTPSQEITSILGPLESQEVGEWLFKNSRADSIIATNFLFRSLNSETQVFGDDYSLAVWSHREFLVLGPKFFGVAETAGDEIDLCIRFADAPTEADALLLSERGVSWFVVDLLATSQRSWEPYGDVAFRSDRFWVVKLRSSISSAHSASSGWSVRENQKPIDKTCCNRRGSGNVLVG
jgi:hypothetical protein